MPRRVSTTAGCAGNTGCLASGVGVAAGAGVDAGAAGACPFAQASKQASRCASSASEVHACRAELSCAWTRTGSAAARPHKASLDIPRCYAGWRLGGGASVGSALRPPTATLLFPQDESAPGSFAVAGPGATDFTAAGAVDDVAQPGGGDVHAIARFLEREAVVVQVAGELRAPAAAVGRAAEAPEVLRVRLQRHRERVPLALHLRLPLAQQSRNGDFAVGRAGRLRRCASGCERER